MAVRRKNIELYSTKSIGTSTHLWSNGSEGRSLDVNIHSAEVLAVYQTVETARRTRLGQTTRIRARPALFKVLGMNFLINGCIIISYTGRLKTIASFPGFTLVLRPIAT